MLSFHTEKNKVWLVGWLVVFNVPSHRQRGHLERAPPFTVPGRT